MGFLVGIEKGHGVVQGQIIASQAAPDHSRMGREHRGDRNLGVFEIKQT